jgi:hypothetical protein
MTELSEGRSGQPILGDAKECRLCGAVAVLSQIPERTAGFGGADGHALPPPMPAHLAWVCQECEDEEPA